MPSDITLSASVPQGNVPAVVCLWSVAGALLFYSAYMMSAVYISDLDAIAMSAIAGSTLVLLWAAAGLRKYLSAKWLYAMGAGVLAMQSANLILLSIAPQAVIFVNFAALHALSILAALILGIYGWMAPRHIRFIVLAAGLLCVAGAFLFPFMPLPSVVGTAFGVIPAAAVGCWCCSRAVALR